MPTTYIGKQNVQISNKQTKENWHLQHEHIHVRYILLFIY